MFQVWIKPKIIPLVTSLIWTEFALILVMFTELKILRGPHHILVCELNLSVQLQCLVWCGVVITHGHNDVSQVIVTQQYILSIILV